MQPCLCEHFDHNIGLHRFLFYFWNHEIWLHWQVVDNIGPVVVRHDLFLICSPTNLNFEPRTLTLPNKGSSTIGHHPRPPPPTPNSAFKTRLTFKLKIKWWDKTFYASGPHYSSGEKKAKKKMVNVTMVKKSLAFYLTRPTSRVCEKMYFEMEPRPGNMRPYDFHETIPLHPQVKASFF